MRENRGYMHLHGETPAAVYGSDWLGEFGFGFGDEDEGPGDEASYEESAPSDAGASVSFAPSTPSGGGGASSFPQTSDGGLSEPYPDEDLTGGASVEDKRPITMDDAGPKLATFVDEFGDVQVDLEAYSKQVLTGISAAIQRLIDTGTWTVEMANKEGYYQQPDGSWLHQAQPSGEFGYDYGMYQYSGWNSVGFGAVKKPAVRMAMRRPALPARPGGRPPVPVGKKPKTVRATANKVIVKANALMRRGMPRKLAVQKMRAAMTKTFKKLAPKIAARKRR